MFSWCCGCFGGGFNWRFLYLGFDVYVGVGELVLSLCEVGVESRFLREVRVFEGCSFFERGD